MRGANYLGGGNYLLPSLCKWISEEDPQKLSCRGWGRARHFPISLNPKTMEIAFHPLMDTHLLTLPMSTREEGERVRAAEGARAGLGKPALTPFGQFSAKGTEEGS